jgi:hypothetical protein
VPPARLRLSVEVIKLAAWSAAAACGVLGLSCLWLVARLSRARRPA